MPISVGTPLVNMSEDEFAAVSYDVIKEAFQLHHELGPLFDERVYQNALVARMDNLQSEVKIAVSFQDFSKSY